MNPLRRLNIFVHPVNTQWPGSVSIRQRERAESVHS